MGKWRYIASRLNGDGTETFLSYDVPISGCQVTDVLSGAGGISGVAIRDSQRALWKALRIVAEPGGAAAMAALLSRRWKARPGQTIGVLLCGANTTAVTF